MNSLLVLHAACQPATRKVGLWSSSMRSAIRAAEPYGRGASPAGPPITTGNVWRLFAQLKRMQTPIF